MKRLLKMYAMFAVVCMVFALGACSHSSSGGSDSDESDAGNGGNGTGSLAESLAGTSWTSSSKTLDFSTDGTVIYFNGSDYSKGEYYDYTGDTQGEGVAVFLKQWSSDDKSYSDSNNWWGFFVILKSDGTLYAQEFSWVDSGYALDGYNQDTYTKSQSNPSSDTGGDEGSTKLSYSFVGTVPEVAAYISGLTSDGIYSVKVVDSITESCGELKEALMTKDTNFTGYPITLDLSESVLKIDEKAFEKCRALVSCTLPSKADSIGDYAFNGCSYMTSVTISESVKSIGTGAFNGCTYLETAPLPSSLVSIGESAFNACMTLQEVSIPSSVTTVGDSAFKGCTELKSVSVPASLKSISDYMFSGCTALEEVEIASGVEEIGEYAFQRCNVLSKITIPQSVNTIGMYAFTRCIALSSIDIPSVSIGMSAFSKCTSLEDVKILSPVEIIAMYAFEDCSALSSATFKVKSGWKAGDTEITESDLNNTETAAEYLRSTYKSKEWTRS